MIFTYYPYVFWHKRKIHNFDPYNVFLAIAININIPVILKTGSMLQGHIYELYLTILCIINISDKFTDYYLIYKALKG